MKINRSFHLQKKNIILACLLPLLFIADIFYGLADFYRIEMPVTPGVLFRGFVFLWAVCLVAFVLIKVNKGLQFIILLLSFLTVPSLIIGVFTSKDMLYDISSLSKVLYLPFVTGMFVAFRSRNNISNDDIFRFIELTAVTLGISLLVSQQLGMQRETYGDYAFGSTGIFYAQNDMTLAFGLALLSSGYRLAVVEFSWLRLLALILVAFACVQIGTRASLVVVLATAMTASACVIWGSNGERPLPFDHLKRWIISVLLVFTMISVLVYGIARQQEFSYQQKKFDEIAEGEFPRIALVLAGIEHITHRPALYDFFGEGSDSYQRGIASLYPKTDKWRMVEVDWMDIYGAYGILFTIGIHLFVIFVLMKTLTKFLFKREAFQGIIASASLLYLGHSIFAGHAITSPIPTTIMSGYFSICFNIYNNRH